ncbi:MAG TPA: twin-arginine translocation signal domain-containing protein [Caldimonas sp.]|jgi:hypothetical protein|nr:twin-arginine translocation signal domain-containing protein [Caldimonas sp.]HEX2539867.1 twin-arginine translocation signal domain-containing protein [Caldimonas sp.]
MRFFARKSPAKADAAIAPTTSRRSVVVGAGVAGVAAVSAAVLHRQVVDAPAALPEAESAAEDGYRVTPHVLRYYETTRS